MHSSISPNKRLSYQERAGMCRNQAAKNLLTLMAEKKTNLSVAADLTQSEKLLSLADRIGPEICLLKTHIDILEDFTPQVTEELKKIARKHHFLLFEDRKFADIGNTVFHQYAGGIYQISKWADIINAHIVPGPGIIQGLQQAALGTGSGLLLLAEMSSQGTLACGSYTERALSFANLYPDFVIGFIALKKISSNPMHLHMTPGIQLKNGIDSLGQQYQTPESAVAAGTDVIIVGRGIYTADDPQKTASLYKNRGWQAYIKSYGQT